MPDADLPFNHEDGMEQHSLLSHVLIGHPAMFTVAELVSELTLDPEEFGQRDGVERAIRDLAGLRLLHRHGPFVLPTRAALHFHRLWDTYE